jgi:hypothetical protein
MELFNVTNILMKGHNLYWKIPSKQTKRAPPPKKKEEVEIIEPVIAEHAI